MDTNLWVPLYLALRCPSNITVDPNRPLQLLLEWLTPVAKPTNHQTSLPFILITNPMRYAANIVGCTSEEVYWCIHQQAIPRIPRGRYLYE
jgi:hypothetical protein